MRHDMIGNKIAEKWTLEKAQDLFRQMRDYQLNADNVVFIGQMCDKFNIYIELVSFLADKFKDDEFVFQTYKQISTTCQTRLYAGALAGKFRERSALFGLTANHGWTGERSESKVETNQPTAIIVNTSGVAPIKSEKDIVDNE